MTRRRLAVGKMDVSVGEENPLRSLSNKVFQNPLLLDKILDYVIHDKTKVLLPAIRSTRLVNKDWVFATNRLLAKSKEAVFRIRLTPTNSTAGTAYVEKHGKVLNQLSSSLTLRKDKRAPLFSLIASPDFFQNRTQQNLLKCLTEYGANLVELHLPLDTNCILKPLDPGTRLPNLRSFSVGAKRLNCVDSLLDFVNSVIGANGQLTEISLKWPNTTVIKKLENFVLPTSITNVSLPVPWTKNYFQVLLRNPLPNLKTLKLQGVLVHGTEQLLFNMFQHFSTTLEEFHVCKDNDLVLHTPFRMPTMAKLKFLKIDLVEVQLRGNVPAEEQRLLPSLMLFTRCSPSPVLVSVLAEGLRFDSVTCLTVSCYWSGLWFYGFYDIETLPRMFPNLVKFNATIDECLAMKMKHVWRDMTGLRELRICVVVTSSKYLSFTEIWWNHILTGLSDDKLRVLERSPDPLAVLGQTRHASIRNLTGLETLHLESLAKQNNALISDAAFIFAFLMMPKLSKLTLLGNFFASREMKAAWEEQGTQLGIERELRGDDDE